MFSPPVTEDAVPLAVLNTPAVIEEPTPLAMLLVPPVIVAYWASDLVATAGDQAGVAGVVVPVSDDQVV